MPVHQRQLQGPKRANQNQPGKLKCSSIARRTPHWIFGYRTRRVKNVASDCRISRFRSSKMDFTFEEGDDSVLGVACRRSGLVLICRDDDEVLVHAKVVPPQLPDFARPKCSPNAETGECPSSEVSTASPYHHRRQLSQVASSNANSSSVTTRLRPISKHWQSPLWIAANPTAVHRVVEGPPARPHMMVNRNGTELRSLQLHTKSVPCDRLTFGNHEVSVPLVESLEITRVELVGVRPGCCV